MRAHGIPTASRQTRARCMQSPMHAGVAPAVQSRQRPQQSRAGPVLHAIATAADTRKARQAVLESIKPLGMDVSQYPDQEDRNVLITGCARGIGFNTARFLAALGATVYMADIDEAGLQSAAEAIRKQIPGARVVVTPRLHLGSQAAVHSWCDEWLSGRVTGSVGSSTPTLDILINNAGANFMGVEPWFTDQGVAGLPQVNFLGPYTLTRRLLPCLAAASQSPRVVNLASVMHRFSELPEDPQFFLRDWWKGGAYRNCKHGNVVFTCLLQQAAQASPSLSGLTVVAVDPGAVYSNIWSTSKVFGKPPGSTLLQAMFSTPQDACATSVHAAVGPDVQGGQYWARGLFASDLIVKPMGAWGRCVELLGLAGPAAQPRGLASRAKAVEISPRALSAVSDGRGVALWDAAAKLSGLSTWSQGL